MSSDSAAVPHWHIAETSHATASTLWGDWGDYRSIANTQGQCDVYLVDDDPDVRRTIRNLVNSSGWSVRDFRSAEDLLAHGDFSRTAAHCLLLDIGLPGMDGLSLQKELVKRRIAIPIIVLSGIADVPIAVRAMQAGALDVLQKPVRRDELQRLVALALDADRQRCEREVAREHLQNRIAMLTLREQETMQCLVAGKNTKELSAALGIGTQTVLKHKASLLRKLQVRNELELVRQLTAHDLSNGPAPAAPPVPARRS